MNVKLRRLACTSLIFLSGCSLFAKKKDQAVVRPVSQDPLPAAHEPRPKALAIANGNTSKETPLADPVPPPPPDLIIADIPSSPASKGTAIVSQPKPNGPMDPVIPAAGVAPVIEPPPLSREITRTPAIANPAAVAPSIVTPVTTAPEKTSPVAVAENPIASLKRVQQLAAEKLTRLDGFESRLTRRETIGSNPMPEQLILYKYRVQPKSMHLKWIGVEAKGRELVFVGGRKSDMVEILTARGDGFALTPAGKRLSFPPTAPPVRNQSRYDLREGGMPLAITNLGQTLAKAERDPATAGRLKYLGKIKRPERAAPFEAIEETLPMGMELLFPKGGKRTLYFDADPASASYGLPILVTASNELGKDVEYYYFDQLKPMKFTDADFDADQLWKK